MSIKRILNLNNLLNKKSFFLFGPRETGKSYWINQQLAESAYIINLLRSDIYLRLNQNPSELENMIAASNYPNRVVIDEIQRIPMLLNEVHRLIEEKEIHFLLTGSSARRLHKDDVNLLGGRAWEARMFPLTSNEIPNFNLDRYLRYGGLPPVVLSEFPEEELIAYVSAYLKEEIQAESLVRKLPAFSRFLSVAALSSGHMINFASIASDSNIPASSAREYYQILEDTFIGFILPAWTKSVKRKAISTAKFYLFDIGVRNTLAGIEHIEPKSELYGRLFEHFIALELRAYLSYRRIHKTLSYWQSKYGHEVDFIIGDKTAIEVKTTNRLQDKHFKGLKKLSEENICQQYIVVSMDKINRKFDQFKTIYWEDFLKKLWGDEFVF